MKWWCALQRRLGKGGLTIYATEVVPAIEVLKAQTQNPYKLNKRLARRILLCC